MDARSYNARSAELGVVLTCVGPLEGGKTCSRQRLPARSLALSGWPFRSARGYIMLRTRNRVAKHVVYGEVGRGESLTRLVDVRRIV
jgi:hypothetical protein